MADAQSFGRDNLHKLLYRLFGYERGGAKNFLGAKSCGIFRGDSKFIRRTVGDILSKFYRLVGNFMGCNVAVDILFIVRDNNNFLCAVKRLEVQARRTGNFNLRRRAHDFCNVLDELFKLVVRRLGNYSRRAGAIFYPACADDFWRVVNLAAAEA